MAAVEYGDPEKHIVEKVSDTSSDVRNDNEGIYAREELVDPDKDETLHRGLSARQISMIAVSTTLRTSATPLADLACRKLGGAVGTGLIIGSGTALVRGGPLGIFLGYSFVGMVCYMVREKSTSASCCVF